MPAGTQPYLIDLTPSGANLDWNSNAFPTARVTLTQNLTMVPGSAPPSGATVLLMIKQDAVGGRTFTWSSLYKWPGGVVPTMSTAANATDIASFLSDGNFLYGNILVGFA